MQKNRFFVVCRSKLHFVKLNGQNCFGFGIGGGFDRALRWSIGWQDFERRHFVKVIIFILYITIIKAFRWFS